MKSQLDSKGDKILDEKNKRCAGIANEIAKRKVMERTVDELYDWIHELHSEIETARQAMRAAVTEVKAAGKEVSEKLLSLSDDGVMAFAEDMADQR